LKSKSIEFFQSYLSTLSIAGVDGTLAKRMRGTAAANNLMAKTGTHRDVSSLAGYTNTLDGEIFLFAFVFNGSNVGIYKQLENDISSIISNYTSYIPNANSSYRQTILSIIINAILIIIALIMIFQCFGCYCCR